MTATNNILRRLGAALLALPMLVAASTEGGEYVWRNVRVGAGGFAPGIVFSRAERDLAYLRTDMGGAYRWDARAQAWVPLQDGFDVSSYSGIESIAPHPLDGARVYVAAGMGKRQPAAILRSADRGATWDVVPVPFRMGGNEDGRGLGERLAVDPHRLGMLWFGSRHDGLWQSIDDGRRWARVATFPYRGQGVPEGRGTNAGLSFVLVDARAGSRRIVAGIADADAAGVAISDDAGATWQVEPVPPGLLPIKADLDLAGTLYVTFANGIGPGGVTAGALRARSDAGRWRDISPQRGGAGGGYIGIAADRALPGTLIVSTFNRWQPGDTVWRTTDGGRHWTDIGARSHRDTRATPFLNWGAAEAEFGHWVAGLALDPFDTRSAAYTTGATVYRTANLPQSRRVDWLPWTRGIEQTAVITLISPTGGAPLISGFGDLGGFVHADLTISPAGMHLNPRHTNTNTLDYAGRAPLIVVRSGNVHADQPATAGLGWSADGGRRWAPLHTPDWVAGTSLEAFGRAPISVAADGVRLHVGAEHGWFSDDRGRTWARAVGLPGGLRVTADKIDPRRAWAIDHVTGRLLAISDGGRRYAPIAARGACADLRATAPRNRESQPALVASPFRAGELYLGCAGELYRSRDAGVSFAAVGGGLRVALFGLGKGANDRDPALFVTGVRAGVTGIYRSLDGGAHWRRIDDDRHRFGHRYRAISGDPRRFGRVYVATDGRGIVYGDPGAR